MTTAFRLKTSPEILATMVARARVLWRLRNGDDAFDLNIGSTFRTVLESAALSDAEQYIQIGKLLALRSLDDAMDDDLDELAKQFGADIFPPLKRRPPRTSISNVSAGDGTLAAFGLLAVGASIGDTVVTLSDGSEFKSSGAVTIDAGTAQAETIIYTRAGDVLTIVYPTTGLATSHQVNAAVRFISTRSQLASGVAIAATSIPLKPGTGAAWDPTGSVVLDRGAVNEEKLAFTRTGDTLTVTPTTFAHAIDTFAYQATSLSGNRVVSAGSVCFVPATDASKQINYRTTLSGVLLDGDIVSDLIPVESVEAGVQTLAGSNSITRWSAAPFTGATVTNPIAATRGADREKNEPYRQRIKDFIQSLSRGTPLAIVTGISGLEDPSTGQVVAYASIIEPVSPGLSYVYVTDGTATFSLTQVPFIGRDVIISDAEVGDARGRLGQYGPFSVGTTPITPRLFRSIERGAATDTGANYLEDTSQAMGINAYAGKFLKSDDDQFYPIVSNTAIRFIVTAGGGTPSLGSYSVHDFTTSPLTPGVDFDFNESNGDLELTTPLLAHDSLVAASDGAGVGVGAYTYTTGLGAYVQRVINGDPTNFTDFPGIRSSGTKVVVRAPTVVSPTITFQVVAARGFTDDQLRPSVTTAMVVSVNAGGLGDNIVLSELIRQVKELPGVFDVKPILPTSNIVIGKDQIARVTSDDVVIA
jgi:uncharacterized phage protein gp47/JayE